MKNIKRQLKLKANMVIFGIYSRFKVLRMTEDERRRLSRVALVIK